MKYVIKLGTWEGMGNKKHFFTRLYIKGKWTPFCKKELITKKAKKIANGNIEIEEFWCFLLGGKNK